MKFRKIIFSIAIGLLLVQGLLAQTNDRTLFRSGVDLYKQGKYLDAQQSFFTILKKYRDTPLQTATKLMLGKTYYKLKDYKSALIVCNNFIKTNKNSSYLDDIYFLKGEIQYRQGEYESAVEDWLWLNYNQSDPRLEKQASEYAFKTIEYNFSESDLANLRNQYHGEVIEGLMNVLDARRLMDEGDNAAAARILNRFVESSPGHPYAAIARQMLEGKMENAVATNNILMLESSDDTGRTISDDIALGAMYAAYEMSTRNPEKTVQLDTLRLDPGVLDALNETSQALEDRNPLAVVGPIDNDQTASLALLSKYERFPLISPLNSQHGLAKLSPYTFQINPDAVIKGRFLAEYAVRDLGYKTFAILAPVNEYGQTIAKSFEETVVQNGGEVVETQWYYTDTQDFSRQFKAIRSKGFFIAFRDSVLQENPGLTPEEVENQFKTYMSDELFSNDSQREIDSTQIASSGIDAIFIPTYPDDIPFIAPQFAFHNIQAALLGNEGWNDPDQLMKQRAYLEGLVYVTAGYFDPASWNYKEFMTRFRIQMKTTPNIYHLLGYDIAKWMIENYQPGMQREAFRNALENSKLYRGILENIQFRQGSRVNSELNILKFTRGQIIKEK